MNFDMNQLQSVFATLVVFGTALSPVTFYALEMFKPFLSNEKYKPVAILIGLVVGLLLVFLSPYLGIEGLNYAVGAVGGIIGGYLATLQYEKAAKNTVEKIEEEEKQ